MRKLNMRIIMGMTTTTINMAMIAVAGTTITTDTAISMAESAHLPLTIWLSPAFPVGAFAYSHALEWALALAPSRERRLETAQQGTAFVTAMRTSWPCAALDALTNETAYPVALGAAAGAHDLPLAATLEHFLLAFTANLVSAAVRLGPIGQTDGQRVTAAALPAIHETARFALHSTLDDLGSATIRADLFSMQHETQYSRLFRS